MSYNHILSDKDYLWSYSKLSCFDMCKYMFFLNYLLKEPTENKYFAQYGTFNHKIHELVYKGELPCKDVLGYYITNFHKEVTSTPPSVNIYESYFQKGITYWKSFKPSPNKILMVEKELEFTIGEYKFVGVIDLVEETRNGEIIITDHKSRDIKPRSKRGKKTHKDEQLDYMLHQLYLYSIAVKDLLGKYPTELNYNCFKNGTYIVNPFSIDGLENTKTWVNATIDKICNNSDWSPNLGLWQCNHICSVNKQCDYFEIVDWR